MDTTSTGFLINSISRFIHLVSCRAIKLRPLQQDYKNMVVVLKHLKTVLDELIDRRLPPDESLPKECEELDLAVNDARELMETWSSKMSKICGVWQSGSLLIKIQSSSLEIGHIIYRLLQSTPSTSRLNCVQKCLQELKSLEQEMTSKHIEVAMSSLKADVVPCTDHFLKIIEALDLTSKGELLKESIALEKKRLNSQNVKDQGDLNQIRQAEELISHIRAYLLNLEHCVPEAGIPIPSYFLCPLSLELMLDPVIGATGQTYDKSSIQTWLDHGFTTCPMTHQSLAHTNLIPNYTVKAMISSWCEQKNLRLSNLRISDVVSSQPARTQNLLQSDSCYPLGTSNATSKASVDVSYGLEKKDYPFSSGLHEEVSMICQTMENHCIENQSHELSYMHSWSGSTTSAISDAEYMVRASNDFSRISPSLENGRNSGEIGFEGLVGSHSNNQSGQMSSKQSHQDSRTVKADGASRDNKAANGIHHLGRAHSFSLPEPGIDDSTTKSRIVDLVDDLKKSQSIDLQTAAAAELRLLAKNSMENRVIIGSAGAISPLVLLLYSKVELTQEHAVSALLNLSINDQNKAKIAEAEAVGPLIHVLKTGSNVAKENSAATLFSLSVLEDYKATIGCSGAVKALVNLLGSGTLRGRKDAATALFNLSIFHENKARIVQAGAVKYLIEMMDPSTGMLDKAVALLANLSTISEGRLAIVRAEGIPPLVEILDSGSQRGKENAASVLLQLCLNSSKFCHLVLQEGAVPPLVALSQSGTPRAKEKAQLLLGHFRNQREGTKGKGRS